MENESSSDTKILFKKLCESNYSIEHKLIYSYSLSNLFSFIEFVVKVK